MADWFTTYSGKKFDVLNPSPSMVDLNDIAHHLSLINRYTGATRVPYTVAEHSVRVASVLQVAKAPRLYEMFALLHDAHEYVLGDWSRPVKRAVGYEVYARLESSVQSVIHIALGLPQIVPDDAQSLIKYADNSLLLTEARDLIHAKISENFDKTFDGVELSYHIDEPWSAARAEELFLTYFGTLHDKLRKN